MDEVLGLGLLSGDAVWLRAASWFDAQIRTRQKYMKLTHDTIQKLWSKNHLKNRVLEYIEILHRESGKKV